MKHPSPARKAGGVGRADYSGAKQTTSRHRLLTSARSQRRIRSFLKLLSQGRWFEKMKQPLTCPVNAACGLRQCPPLAAGEDHLQPGRGAFHIGFCGPLCSSVSIIARAFQGNGRPRSPPPIGNSGRQPTISLKRSTQNHQRSTSCAVGPLPHLLVKGHPAARPRLPLMTQAV